MQRRRRRLYGEPPPYPCFEFGRLGLWRSGRCFRGNKSTAPPEPRPGPPEHPARPLLGWEGRTVRTDCGGKARGGGSGAGGATPLPLLRRRRRNKG